MLNLLALLQYEYYWNWFWTFFVIVAYDREGGGDDWLGLLYWLGWLVVIITATKILIYTETLLSSTSIFTNPQIFIVLLSNLNFFFFYIHKREDLNEGYNTSIRLLLTDSILFHDWINTLLLKTNLIFKVVLFIH